MPNSYFSDKKVEFNIPANRMITLSGYTSDGGNFSCQDYVFSFTPKANHVYDIQLKVTDTPKVACELTIQDLTTHTTQSYQKRHFTRNFITGAGRCDDKAN